MNLPKDDPQYELLAGIQYAAEKWFTGDEFYQAVAAIIERDQTNLEHVPYNDDMIRLPGGRIVRVAVTVDVNVVDESEVITDD